MTFKPSEVVDRELRNRLNVSDVNDRRAVLTALKKRYPAQVQRLELETRGFAVSPTTTPVVAPSSTHGRELPAESEAREARETLADELSMLVAHLAVRPWKAAHQTWQQNILDCTDETFAAARRAPDGSYFDQALIGIRRLQEHAFQARVLSGRNQALLADYRRLATGIDRCAMAARVLIGQALHDNAPDGDGAVGIRSDELRARRDAALAGLRALRALDGTGERLAAGAYALSRIDRALIEADAEELHVYLTDAGLGATLDKLIQDAAAIGSTRGALSPNGASELARMEELRDLLLGIDDEVEAVQGFSRPLEAFITTLSAAARGAGYIELAVPLQFALGRTRGGGAAITLAELLSVRELLAHVAEEAAGCCDTGETVITQRLENDEALLAFDRLIDLCASDGTELDVNGRAADYFALLPSRVLT